MAAGLGFKTFNTGDVLTAGDTNGYLMQGILVFASSAARTAALPSPDEGQACFLKDTDSFEIYTGSAWTSFTPGIDKSCRAKQNAATSIGTTFTTIAFQTEDFDTDTIHDNSTNNSRLTIKTAGKYLVGTTVTTAVNQSMAVRILYNSASVISGLQSAGNGADDSRAISTFFNFNVNDFVEVQARMGTSAANSSGDLQTNFWCFKVA